eukprot:TRINITY_DN8703_c0_g1_i1.p2 TRINITY_DN8703_c0_g1~~TRINITY_DN8703_c0_g1_i1.p2  ORF type:complete len:153 (+),score=32.52 TRINITY_DN8703_c0_g1_i1:43-501(+)
MEDTKESITNLKETAEGKDRSGSGPEAVIAALSFSLADTLSSTLAACESQNKVQIINHSRDVASTLDQIVAQANIWSASIPATDKTQQERIVSAAIRARKGATTLKVSAAMVAAGGGSAKLDSVRSAVEETCDGLVALLELSAFSGLSWTSA